MPRPPAPSRSVPSHLLLAAAPFAPRGGGDDGALLPSRASRSPPCLLPAEAVGYGTVTPDLQREIDRVVDQGLALGRVSAKQNPEQLAADLVRCADFAGSGTAWNTGWTTSDPAEVRARTAARGADAGARPTATTTTGDLDVLGSMRRTAGLHSRPPAPPPSVPS